jgi:hypothetical protein
VLHPLKKINVEGNKELEVLSNYLLEMEYFPVLIEEVGEVGAALQGDGNLVEELIQLASVCVRWLENINQIKK